MTAFVDDWSSLLWSLVSGAPGLGTSTSAWSLPLGLRDTATRLAAWVAPNGLPRVLRTDQASRDVAPWSLLFAGARYPTMEALVGGRDLPTIAQQLGVLIEHLAGGDGMVTPDPVHPPDLIVVSHHAGAASHPDAVTAIAQRIAQWKATDSDLPVVIVVPAFLGPLGAHALLALYGAIDDQLIDLRPNAGGPDPMDLSRYVTAPLHLVVADDRHLDRIATVLARIRVLHAGHRPALVAVSVTAPAVLDVVSAAPADWAGLITVASPADGAGFDLRDADVVKAVRFVRGLALPEGPHRFAIETMAQCIDGWMVDDLGQRQPLPTPADLWFVAPVAGAAHVPDLRIAAACGAGFDDALTLALALDDAATGEDPANLLLGIAAPFLATTTLDAGDIDIASEVRLELASIGSGDHATPALAFSITVRRRAGWLVGPSGMNGTTPVDIQVGALRLHARVEFGTGVANAEIVLDDVVVRGRHMVTLGPDDAAFASAAAQALSALAKVESRVPNAKVVLDFLEQGLGVVRRAAAAAGGTAWLSDALMQCLSDPRAWLTQRAQSVLAGAWSADAPTFFGLKVDRSAPAGTRRWTWDGPDVPLRVTVSDLPWRVTVESLAAPISLGILGGDLRIGGSVTWILGGAMSCEFELALGELRLRRFADGSIMLGDPLLDPPLLVRDGAGHTPADLPVRLARPLASVIGAHLLEALLDPDSESPGSWRAMAMLLADPVAALRGGMRQAPSMLQDVLMQVRLDLPALRRASAPPPL